MLSRAVNQIAQSPWARLVWAGVGVLALIQVVAFYRLCMDQVAKAHARETILVQQRHAQTDCLKYMDGSTISSCSRQASRKRGAAGQALLNGAVPVSYVFH